MRLAGIHHVALRVFDLDAAAERWSRQFGFTERERHDERVLLAWRLSAEQWELMGRKADEPGLCRSVARLQRG